IQHGPAAHTFMECAIWKGAQERTAIGTRAPARVGQTRRCVELRPSRTDGRLVAHPISLRAERHGDTTAAVAPGVGCAWPYNLHSAVASVFHRGSLPFNLKRTYF